MSDALTIADTPGALTTEWLTSALAPHLDGHRVTDVALKPIGTGQMCDSVRLTLTTDGPSRLPSTIVAKQPAADETSRNTALALGSYENEVRFYQQLAAELPMRTPRVFHADIDVETASFVLLLEDLAPGEQGDQLVGCSPSHAEVAVDELVKLHAPRWGDPTLAAIDWLHRDPEAGRQFLVGMLPTLWAGFSDRYADVLSAEAKQAGAMLFDNLGGYLLADTQPWTVVHGDYRLDNLLFGPTPADTPIAVVDWQTCTHGPGLQDVSYFIGAGLLPDDRRAVEVDLVRRYHAGLLGAGVEGYDWDRCWYDYRRCTWAGLVMAVAASMLVERTERGDEMFMVMADRHSRHALDHDAGETLTGA